MEIKHTIKLSSGKEIELTEHEYKELVDQFKTKIEYVPYYPYYEYPQPQWPFQTWITCNDTTGEIQSSQVTPLHELGIYL